jgi:hypothetical protein
LTSARLLRNLLGVRIEPVTEEEGQAAKRSLFEPFLEDEGITPKYLAQKLKEEMEATEKKVFHDKNEIIYSEPLVAWEVRQRGRQDAHKLRGDYAPIEVDARHHLGNLSDEQINLKLSVLMEKVMSPDPEKPVDE